MDVTSKTTFYDLPINLQIYILQKLHWTDQNNVRRASYQSLVVMNHIRKQVGIHRRISDFNESLGRLMASTYASIDSLYISNLNIQSLPIISSRRMLIPTTDSLTIGPNISPDVLKLIRYYAKWCKKLEFHDINLPTLKSIKMIGSKDCLANIEEFHIRDRINEFNPKNRYNSNIKLDDVHLVPYARLSALKQFLEWSNLSNLMSLKIELYSWNFDKSQFHKYHYKDSLPLPVHNFNNNFCQHLLNFLRKNEPQLESLSLELNGSIWEYIVNHNGLEFCKNVQHLIIYHRLCWRCKSYSLSICKLLGFNNVKTVKCSSFLSWGWDNGLLWSYTTDKLEYNKKLFLAINETRKGLIIGEQIDTLSWLYQVSSTSILNSLTLKFRYDWHTTFNVAPAFTNVKWTQLSLLSITIFVKTNPPSSWFESFTSWVIQVMPNLQKLYLRYQSTAAPSISVMQRMIMGLNSLRIIMFHHKSIVYYQQNISPIPVELEDWLSQNPQIHLTRIRQKKSENFDIQVEINRP